MAPQFFGSSWFGDLPTCVLSFSLSLSAFSLDILPTIDSNAVCSTPPEKNIQDKSLSWPIDCVIRSANELEVIFLAPNATDIRAFKICSLKLYTPENCSL